jgi:hypothetical protein
MKKSVLSERARARLPASAFVFPDERRFPIHDEFHGRLALIYVMSPSHAASREKVVKAVLSRYPSLRSFWESREGAVGRRRLRAAGRSPVVRPAARRPALPAARRPRAGARTNPSYEDHMPIYVLNPLLSEMRENPLAYDETPVIMVGKPQYRLVRGAKGHKQRSKQKYLPSSETHALNPKTGAAFCGAGADRSGKAKAGMIHPTNKAVVTCMRCIKIINLNDVDQSVPGVKRRLAIIERDLKPSNDKKREKHQMIRGGDQGRFVSGSGAHIRSGKAFRIHKERTAATGGPMYRGSEGIADFQKYAGWMGRPTQTVGEKRSRIAAGRVDAAAARRREAAAEARRLAGIEERLALQEEFAPRMSFEEQEEAFAAAGRRMAASERGRAGATARAAREAEREAARRAARAEGAASRRGLPAEEYMDNPRRGRKSGRAAQKAGLAKGQSLMQKAAAAYRAGKYPTMQSALRGVARKSNPLSEDGMVVNPRRKGAKKSKARSAAQSDAARAMSLFRSGRAHTLADAWAMVKRGR